MDRRSFLRTGAAAAAGIGVAGSLASACSSDGATTTSVAGTPTTLAPGAIDTAAINDLRGSLKGSVLVPGDGGYATASLPANTRYRDIRPAVIARCTDEDDVVTSVKWAREHGVSPVPRGGGHSYAGLSATEGLQIDLSALNGVEMLDGAMCRVGGAAHNSDVFAVVNNSPWLLPGGTCLGVGVGGLVLGGGIGYNTHWAGLTADRLRSTRMVTASGEVVVADESTNPDLFWACRGATGGQFGIHTEFTFELVPVPETVTYYRYEWTGADAALAVLTSFDALMADAPDALNAVAMAKPVPIADGQTARDAISVMSRGQFVGSRAELEATIAPLLAAAPNPTSATVEVLPYWEAATIFLTDEGEAHSWGDISRYSDRVLPEQVWAQQVEGLVDCPSRDDTANGSLWVLGWVGGGVVDQFARTDTAYVHRGMHLLIRPTPVWPTDAPESVAEALMDWTEQMTSYLDGHTPRESYQNFPNRRLTDWAELYYAENLDRLIEVKSTYDPENLFTNEQGIPVTR